MKTLLVSITLVAALITVASGSWKRPDNAQSFRSFAQHIDNPKIDFTDEELQSLENAYPALRKLSDNANAAEYFWQFVRHDDPQRITWAEAYSMIMSGAIYIINEAEMDVWLTARNGRYYVATEPTRGEVETAAKQIDPHGIFIKVLHIK